MKTMTVLALLFSLLASVPALADAPEKAVCIVCASTGETEPEKVEATRAYKGQTYYMCSAKCAAAFDANPAAYVFEVTPAPAASWKTMSGESISLESLRGKVVLLDFWATWCKPCVKSMPELDTLYRDYQKSGLVVVGVSVDQGEDRVKKVTRFLDKKPVGYPIVVDGDSNASWEAFGVAVLPTLFLIDRDGRVVDRWTGLVDIVAVRGTVDRVIGSQAK